VRHQGKARISWDRRRLVSIALAVLGGFVALAAVAPAGLAAGNSTPPSFYNGPLCKAQSHTAFFIYGAAHPEEQETHWRYEYSTGSGGPWTPVPGGSGTITQTEAAPNNGNTGNVTLPYVELTGLGPEVAYRVRGVLTNSSGTSSEEVGCETVPLHPRLGSVGFNNVTATVAHLTGHVVPDGSATSWRFEYSTASKDGPWIAVPGGEGKISRAEAEADPLREQFGVGVGARLTGLNPASVYYFRVLAESEPEWPEGSGEHEHREAASEAGSFETEGPPTVTTFAVHSLDGESVRLLGAVDPHSVPTSAEQTVMLEGSPTGGAFALTFKGQSTRVRSTGALTSGSPTITVPLPVAKGSGNITKGSHLITGLLTSSGEFRAGGTISGPGIPAGSSISRIEGSTLEFTGGGSPATATATGVALSSISSPPFREGESLSGSGIPANTTIVKTGEDPGEGVGTLTLSADASVTTTGVAVTAEIPFDAQAETVEHALNELSNEPGVMVSGPDGGPYNVLFYLKKVAESPQPLMEGDGSGLTPAGTVSVVTAQAGGVGTDTHYHFQYVSQKQFEQPGGEGGFAEAASTPEMEVGAGGSSEVVGADLPSMEAGEAYRYRIVASSEIPGSPVIDGGEQVLTAPVPAQSGPTGECPNERLRGGLSAHLPDCRAYELVTPADKEGAEDIFPSDNFDEGTIVGEDGDHFMLRKPDLQWGPSPDPKSSNYFFARSSGGWQMASARPLGETGPRVYLPALYSSDLTQIGVELLWQTTLSSESESPNVELAAGSPGDPYTPVVSLPHSSVPNGGAWVAGSADLSTMVFRTTDRAVVPGHKSSTVSGEDLYEYSARGGVRQVNVLSNGETIGSCGARMAKGPAEPTGAAEESSPHAVSADGSRVFFEAGSGTDCSDMAASLYMRVGGSETVDIGEYRFLAADAQGGELLLEKRGGGEVFLYDTETRAAKLLRDVSAADAQISADFSTIYFPSAESLTPEAPPAGPGIGDFADYYRYDIATETLRFIFQRETYTGGQNVVLGGGSGEISSNGRYFTFQGRAVGGLPGGEGDEEGRDNHLYRYDSAENVVACLDCGRTYGLPNSASGVAFEFGTVNNDAALANGSPAEVSVSADGQFVFFTTTLALVPSDIDTGQDASDVYEWRASGVDGCAQLQGCLALISDGRDGLRNQLLGIAEEGRDVFFATHEALVPQDQDTSGDVYDARIEGGFSSPQAPPVECEGAACSTPESPPIDATPASFAFMGAGNALQPAGVGGVAKSKKPKPKPKRKGKTKKRSAAAKAKRRDRRPERTVAGRRKTKADVVGKGK
jgi:hypothetical protein